MAKTVTVWLQPLGTGWQACGTGQAITVPPESVVLAADEWGPATASFDLRRDPGVPWPDLTAFTPVDVWVGGMPTWSGYIKETPERDGADRSISVHCEGWQYHLDDDLYERTYVHTRLGDYRDLRSFLAADLTKAVQAGTVTNDGAISIGWPKDTALPGATAVGVMLDLGPGQAAKRVVMDYAVSGSGGGSATVFVRASASAEPIAVGPFDDAATLALGSAGSGTLRGTFATARRYVAVFLYQPTSATLTADVFLKITAIKVFEDPAYEAGDASILKASAVVLDALDIAPLLADDRSSISITTTNIPVYATAGQQTARKSWSDVNAFHDWVAKVDVDRRPVFRPKPSVALYEIGSWSGSMFEDASANSGEDIYNRAVVTGQTPAGDPLLADRSSIDNVVTARGFTKAKELQISNPLPADLIAGDLLADIWLDGKHTTPFRGTVTVTGGGVRRVSTGVTVHPERLLDATTELLRFSDRIDPDTGAFGRDGRIVGVTYTLAADEAQVQIDSSPKSFEALLARLAVVTGAT